MHPVLVKIGWFEVHSYGVMLAIAFLLGLWLTVKRAKKMGLDPNRVMDIAVLVIVAGIVGSRLAYVIPHWQEFRGHWLDTVNPIQSNGQIGIAGMTVIGGFLLAIVVTLIYLWIKKMPVWKIADAFSPAIALGIFVVRIGCFLNGCCYGKPTHSAIGMVFPPNSPAGFMYPNTPIYPTQLFSSLYGLVIFFILLWAEKRYKTFDGFTFFLLWGLYGVARFTVDFFRYYEDSMICLRIGGVAFSWNQAISFGLILLSVGMLVYFYRTKVNSPKKS